jgi:hypothetical protein
MMPKSELALNGTLVGRSNSQECQSGGSRSASAGRGELADDQMRLEPLAPAVHSAPLAPDEDRKARIQAGIQRYSAACGCELASLFMIGATVLFLAYVTFGVANWSAGETLWRGSVWVLSLTVVGKLLGLTYARVRLHMLRSAQRREFRTPG